MFDHTPTQPETKEIQLTQGQVAIVDAADFEYLSQFKWFAQKNRNTFYAVRHTPTVDGKRRLIAMHQVVCGKGADHKDGDGLNNTGSNLRSATHSQNQCNRGPQANNKSGFKGVSWDKRSSKWRASIRFNGKTKYIGTFTDPIEAARAYDAVAREYFGEFARLNEIAEG